MTIESFNQLDDSAKSNFVFDAEMVSQYTDKLVTCTLFVLGKLYLVVTVSKNRLFKKRVEAFDKNNLPVVFKNKIV